jgi:hypothetical protein
LAESFSDTSDKDLETASRVLQRLATVFEKHQLPDQDDDPENPFRGDEPVSGGGSGQPVETSF